MGEFRKGTKDIPDDWSLVVADDQQRLHAIEDYFDVPEVGEAVVLIVSEEALP